MDILGLVLVSFLPGIFWLWLFLRVDRARPSPKRLLALSFVLGTVATVPAGVINTLALGDILSSDGVSLTKWTVAMLVVVGPVEETSKYLAVRFGAYRSAYFQEPIDGLVHSSAASLGFASLENLLYSIAYGPAVMIVRAPLSTVAHLVFGSLWGYGLGLHQQSGRTRFRVVLVGLGGAALLHAAFNIAAFSDYPWISGATVAFGAAWAYRRFEWGARISPFRLRRNYPLIACGKSGEHIRVVSNFCPHCGTRTSRAGSELVCGNCRHLNRPDALYCVSCGDRFLLQA